jgi:8-oxo-dGTP diphosphatase
MKLLDVIDYDRPLEQAELPNIDFKIKRTAVRAVATDAHGRTFMIQATAKSGYYKLPGGGVDPGEDLMAALHREIMEEIGYEATIGEPVGRIVQFDLDKGFLQESLCWLATITGGTGHPQLTQKEVEHGFVTVTFDSLDDAIAAVVAHGFPGGKHSTAITRRELAFLRAAKNS